jgi:hypothetical protein
MVGRSMLVARGARRRESVNAQHHFMLGGIHPDGQRITLADQQTAKTE